MMIRPNLNFFFKPDLIYFFLCSGDRSFLGKDNRTENNFLTFSTVMMKLFFASIFGNSSCFIDEELLPCIMWSRNVETASLICLFSKFIFCWRNKIVRLAPSCDYFLPKKKTFSWNENNLLMSRFLHWVRKISMWSNY
jgi:hypothetical protein